MTDVDVLPPILDLHAFAHAIDASSPSQILDTQIVLMLLGALAGAILLIPSIAHHHVKGWDRTRDLAERTVAAACLGVGAFAATLEALAHAPWFFASGAAAIPAIVSAMWMSLAWPKDSMRENLAGRGAEEPKRDELEDPSP